MDSRTAAIVRDIQSERERLGDDIALLERKVRERADWRAYFARRPWVTMALAVGVGFMLSAFLPRHSH